jgi:hypothetical protein
LTLEQLRLKKGTGNFPMPTTASLIVNNGLRESTRYVMISYQDI